jgi:hypothetical protein
VSPRRFTPLARQRTACHPYRQLCAIEEAVQHLRRHRLPSSRWAPRQDQKARFSPYPRKTPWRSALIGQIRRSRTKFCDRGIPLAPPADSEKPTCSTGKQSLAPRTLNSLSKELNCPSRFAANSRFQICETRCLDGDGNPDRWYAIRDAETVSDADVRAKIRSKIVAWRTTVDEAIAFCAGVGPTPGPATVNNS